MRITVCHHSDPVYLNGSGGRAEEAVELFRTAPAVDYDRLRHDLDEIADQAVTPRG